MEAGIPREARLGGLIHEPPVDAGRPTAALVWKSITEPCLLQASDIRLEDAVWAAAEGQASVEQLALLEADRRASVAVIDRLMDDTEEQLASVERLAGPERSQVVADFTGLLDGLSRVADRLNGVDRSARADGDQVEEVAEP